MVFSSELHYSEIPKDWFLRAYSTYDGMYVLLNDGTFHHVVFFNNDGYCRNAAASQTRVEAIAHFQELIRQDLYLPHANPDTLLLDKPMKINKTFYKKA